MKNLKNWFLALPWVQAAGVVLAAVFFGLAAGAVARNRGKANALGKVAEENAAKGATGSLKKAAKQTERAEHHKQRAELARTKAEARLDNIGARDETLAELVTDWNTDRLRG